MLLAEYRRRLLIHAPSIHTGGGLVLLNEVLRGHATGNLFVQVDARAKGALFEAAATQIKYIKPSIVSRLFAELRLLSWCRAEDAVLCFNSLPPLFPIRGRVIIFVQNRLVIESSSLSAHTFLVRMRLRLERLWSSRLQGHCSRYIVQTPSMAECLGRWLRHKVPISIIAFAPPAPRREPNYEKPHFDFVYVASGDAHKNHMNLLEAWCLNEKAGYRPSLALTLDEASYPELCQQIRKLTAMNGLAVTNLGTLTSDALNELYRTCGALIYPSLTESFGLPLIEAQQRGLPILGPELDYLRDVVVPVETFDPNSPLSIARAVRRFLGSASSTVSVHSADEFLAEVLT